MNLSFFFDFTRPEDVLIIIAITFACLFLVAYIGIIAISVLKNKSSDKAFKSNMTTLLHICYDVKQNRIIGFYENHGTNVQVVDYEAFINQLKSGEREKIKNWFEAIRQNLEGTPSYIRSSTPSLNPSDSITKRHSAKGLIELININEDRTKIYATIHQLNFVPFDQTKWENNFNTVIRQLSNSIYGNSFSSGLYFISLGLVDDSKNVITTDPVAYTLIVDKLTREVADNRDARIYELDADILLIVETPQVANFQYEKAGRDWLKKVNQIIDTNFWSRKIKASVGVITSEVSRQVRILIEEGRKLAQGASDAGEEEAFAMYNAITKKDSIEKTYRTAYNDIMEGTNLLYQYQPIINPATSRVFGYNTRFKPKNSTFKSLTELKIYASRHNDSYELFFEYVSRCYREFEKIDGGNRNTRLFIDIQENEIEFTLKALAHIEHNKNYQVVFVLDEDDFDVEDENYAEMMNYLREFHSSDYELAIRLKSEQLSGNDELYKRFDYFVVPNSGSDFKFREDDRTQIFYTRLLEGLLKYKKPVFCLGAENWFRVELLVRLGIDYISGNDISPFSNTLREIDRRKVTKLNKFAE